MKAGRILAAAGCFLALALAAACLEAGQAAQLQAERGKGTLMALPVPAPAAFKTEEDLSGWKVKIPGGRPLATPAVVDGVLYVGGGFGSHEFYALDARTGKPRWTFKCGDDGPTAAVVSEGCVAYNTESCTLYVQQAKTGKVLWHRWLGDPLMSQPAIAGDLVLMAYPQGGGHRLAAFKLRTGKPAWTQTIPAEIITAPVVAGDDVVAATVDGALHRFDLATGKKHWSRSCRATSAPRVLGRNVLISQRSEKTLRIKDPKGKTASSKITVEGLNVVALADGNVAHAEPLSPVKAAFLLALNRQMQTFTGNNDASIAGQNAYRIMLEASEETLEKVKGNPVPEAEALLKRIRRLLKRKAFEDPAQAIDDAQEALKLAGELERIAARKPDNDKEREAFETLKKTAAQIRAVAAKTKEAAEAAFQARQTITATKNEAKRNQANDAAVGFATPPAAANLQSAAANIGQAHVKAVWAYQGSRPCLLAGRSIMVHGPKVRAVSVASGEVEWEFTFDFAQDATRPVTPPALAGGKLYVGTSDGRIVCLDARRGKRLWQARVGGRILFEPAVVGGCVYAATDDGVLICLKTGDAGADGWHMWGGSAKHNGGER